MITAMPESDPNDPLDAALRESAAAIEDDGFTARVLAALPPRRRDVLRSLVLLSASVIGLALAALWLPWDSLRPLDLSDFYSGNLDPLTPWLLVIAVLSSLAWAAISAFKAEADIL